MYDIPLLELKELLEKLTTKGLGPRPNYDEVDVNPPTFLTKSSTGEQVLAVSSEEATSHYWLDYYGEYRGGYAWIRPELEQFATDHNCNWQWRDPGSIELYPA